MLITPRPLPSSFSCLARLATIRPPVAANGWAAASEPPLTLSFLRSIEPSGLLAAELLGAEALVLPGLQRAEHLRGEGLVDLVVVEVLQGQAGAVEHPRHRVGGRHQQAFALVDVVDGGGLRLGDVGEDRQAALFRPLLGGEQDGRGAVGERRRVGRGHRPLGAAEDRLQLRQLLQAGVGAQVLVAVEPDVGGHQVVEEAAVVGGGEVLVALDRELVLLLAADLPFGRHDRAVLAHREAGARLLVAGDRRDDVAGADLGQLLQFADGRALAVGLEQRLAQALVEGDRRVGGGVGAAGDAGVDLAEGDLVGDEDRRLQAGAAGLLDVVGGGLGGEAGAEHALAGQVAVARVLEDGAAGDLAERLALQAVAVDQPVERRGQHVLVAGVRVDAVGAGEGDPVAADDGDFAGFGVHLGRVLLGVSWKWGWGSSARAGRARRWR